MTTNTFADEKQRFYLRLGQLIAEMPTLEHSGPVPPDTLNWLARISALLHSSDGRLGIQFDVQMDQFCAFQDYTLRAGVIGTMKAMLYREFAAAELEAPVATQGTFIAAGSGYDALVAFGRVLEQAKTDSLIVDPYMDHKTLDDFAVLIPERVPIRLLSDQSAVKASLKPAVSRWQMQHGDIRPLDARITAPRLLHDRLIIIDRQSAFVFTQSLNAFAARSPASIVRVDSETAGLKVAAYDQLWQSAQQL